MVLKELPGGELYQDDGGSYANEATARRHEAIHRQLGAQTAAARAELGASVDDLTARVAAVEAGTSGGAAFTVNAVNYTATFTMTTGA